MYFDPMVTQEKVTDSPRRFAVTMNTVCHVLNHNRADTETLLYLGNRLNNLLYPEVPTLENWKESTIPVRPAILFVANVEEMTHAATHAGHQLVHDYDENPFKLAVIGINDTTAPRWGEELLIQAEFNDYQRAYYYGVETGNIKLIDKMLDLLVSLTCNCDDPEANEPEARFTKEEQNRFNDSLKQLKSSGVTVDEELSLRLSTLGEEKGYFTGFTPHTNPTVRKGLFE